MFGDPPGLSVLGVGLAEVAENITLVQSHGDGAARQAKRLFPPLAPR